MTGQISVINKESEQVAAFNWKGSPVKGRGVWWYSSDKIKKTIEGIMESKADLSRVSFSDAYREGNTTFGWQGFSGWFQALLLSLPVNGLAVDLENVVWPMMVPGKPNPE